MSRLLSTPIITLLVSLFITVFGNFSFWEQLASRLSLRDEPILFVSFFIVILTLINFLLTLVSFKPIFKIMTIIILMTSAFAAYFMDNYAVMIDTGMIHNTLATNVHEASELFSFKLVLTVLLLGLIPSYLILKAKIRYQPFFKGLLQKILIVIACLGVIAGTLYSNYQELSFFGRNNRELRHLINPTNYILSLKSIIKTRIGEGKIIVKPITNDAKKDVLNTSSKPSLIVLVLGETARAMNFSLNGYQRNTNPLLSKQDIINFTDVTSCGTATAVSVPCMFSKFSRSDYSGSKGKQYENLLDVAKQAGYQVLWRDNNTGCQGTCKRIEYKDLTGTQDSKFCASGNCVDEVLLDDLRNLVAESKGDKLIVLHQNGNHGPTYFKRYPEKFEVFKPTCKTNQLRNCSREEVVNSYDNAILYTDYFVSQTIDFLKEANKDYDTALVYISDHGESLGENNLYLHGLPYIIAPKQQKKVPFLLWLSDDYQQTHHINESCLEKKSSQTLSHDNLFSSMLGLMSIQTSVRDERLDIFATCSSK